MNTFALLVLFYLTVIKCQIVASSCTAQDGSCTWTEPVLCQNPASYCLNGAECLIVTQSINSSYPPELSSGIDQQFQCHCPVANDCTNAEQQVVSGNSSETMELSGTSINVIYAEMWGCFDVSVKSLHSSNRASSVSFSERAIGEDLGCTKTSQLLPNVLALVRYWCQHKARCVIDPSLIMSHVGLPNVPSRLPDEYIITWRIELSREAGMKCDGSDSTLYEKSCYRLTPRDLDWKEARSFCLRRGGDLAHFTDKIQFAGILRSLDSSTPTLIDKSTAIPIWFKWYTWSGEQRESKYFTEYTDSFQCGVYDFNINGPNPLVNCNTGKRSKKVRGLCALPPVVDVILPPKAVKCPLKCVPEYPDYCWGEVDGDTTEIKTCPEPFSGDATWTCGIDGQWATPLPDLSKCTNPEVDAPINQANEDLNSGSNPSTTLDTLTTTINDKQLAPGNLPQLDDTVRLAINKQTEILLIEEDPNVRDAISKDFTVTVTDLNNVILDNSVAFWGLPLFSRDEEIDKVQRNVDDTLFLLADNLLGDEPYVKQDANLAVQVENRNKENYGNKTYTLVVDEKDRLILPAGFPYAINDTKTPLYFVDYPGIQNLFHGDTLAQWEEDENATVKPIRQAVVSRMLGSTLGQSNQSVQFIEGKVEILLSTVGLDRYDVNQTTAQCAYWNTSEKDWAFDGCEMVPTKDKSVTLCRCDHLTNFAVLMDINGIFQNYTVPALDYITVIGESISIVCLSLSVIIFYGVRTLRHDFRFKIHRNLCLNLLIAEILLLFGLNATYNKDLCLSIAVFLHFFFLATFGWMLVEGLYMYFLITKVFEGSGLKHSQYYIIGYGLPVLIVSITLGVTQTSAYENSSYCWLSYDDGAIWAFAGPVAGVILINIVFLAIALSVAFRSRRRNQGRNVRYDFKWIFGVCSLTFILGITWFFGFFYFTEKSVVFAYVYTILNSFQGVMIFLIFVVLSKQVRNDLHRQIVTSELFHDLARCFNVDVDALSHNNRTRDSQSNRTNNSRSAIITR